jgi:hypothetical protein
LAVVDNGRKEDKLRRAAVEDLSFNFRWGVGSLLIADRERREIGWIWPGIGFRITLEMEVIGGKVVKAYKSR